MEVFELKDRRDIRLFNLLMDRYHVQGAKAGLGRNRYFVGIVEGYWVAGAILQEPGSWANLFMKFRVDQGRSYFLRRIAKFAPGDWLLEFLEKLRERLRSEGKEAILTLGLPGHSNALYKKAGFKQIGMTKSGRPVFLLLLQP